MRDQTRTSAAITPLDHNVADFLGTLRDHAFASAALDPGLESTGLTHAEMEQALGMSRPSIANLIRYCDPLLHPPRELRPRGAALSLDVAKGVVVALDIGHSHARVGLADLAGHIHPHVLEQRDEQVLRGADRTLDWAVEAIHDVLEESGQDAADIVGVGISLAGPVDPLKGAIRAAALIDPERGDWQLMSITEHLRNRLGWSEAMPFLLDNDANLGALAEYTWGVARRNPVDGSAYRNVVYVEWSRGIGAGLILDGELYHGEGAAGEFGHMIIDPDADTTCGRCGNRGCLEALVGGEALRVSLDVADVEAVIDAAGTDVHARETLERAARALGQALGGLISIVNPRLVVVGGTLGRAAYALFRPVLMEQLTHSTMRPAMKDADVIPASLPDRPALQGAVARVLRPARRDAGTDRDPLFMYLRRVRERAYAVD